MAADVLLYNALNEINKDLVATSAELSTLITSKLASYGGDPVVEIVANAGPNQANIWCRIPEGSNWTTGFKVCDTGACKILGATCNWTVPAGVTCARFQLWGAGAGNTGPCCCGFSPFGGTGAYASVIIPVTAGCAYTLTSGAGSQGSTDGGNSSVTGFGLTNFCAEGGEGSRSCEINVRCIPGNTYGYCTNQPCYYLGGCLLSDSAVCWTGATTPFGPDCCDINFPMISSCKTFYGSATSGTVYGIRGSFGYIRLNNCGQVACAVHPPIYGFASTSCCGLSFAGSSLAGGCCCAACLSYLVVPGAGGVTSTVAGGCCLAGDFGRLGMVCVSYK
jgi:hypothetical protein